MNKKALILLGVFGALIGYFTLTKQGQTVLTNTTNTIKSISQNGINFLKQLESFSSKAYWDVKGWSIGFGHFMGINKTEDNISMARGLELLKNDLAWCENAIKKYIKVPLTQNQHDALISLIYNIGEGNFSTSSVLRFLNAGKYQDAADAFRLFNKVRKNGVLVVSDYQTTRRAKERALFLSA